MLFALLLLLFAKSVIVPKRPAEQKPTQKPTPTRKSKLGRELSLPSFFYGITDNLDGLADTLLISVGIHPQRHGFVAVAQGLRHAATSAPLVMAMLANV